MSEKLGVVSLERRGNPVFVGMQSQGAGKEYSESKATEIDLEVDRLLTEAHKKAFDILSKKESILHAMSLALLEYETIDGEDVDLLMKGMSLEDLKNIK